MASIQASAKLGTINHQGLPNSVVSAVGASGQSGSVSLATHVGTMTTHAATVVTTLAALVAQGASPTQADVTAVNNAYTALAADLTNVEADSAVLTAVTAGPVTITVDLSVVTTKNVLTAAVRALLRTLLASNQLS